VEPDAASPGEERPPEKEPAAATPAENPAQPAGLFEPQQPPGPQTVSAAAEEPVRAGVQETVSSTVEDPAPASVPEPVPPAVEEAEESASRSEAVLTELAADLDVPRREGPVGKIPPPSIRGRLSPDLEAELTEVLSDTSLEELMAGGASTVQPLLEEESRHTGRVVAVRRDDVFVEMGSREQGIVSARLFPELPAVGADIEVVVQRFNPEEGLYELLIPGTAASIADWTDLHEGLLVDALVTGHNTGGLECEVNHIRGFIPISQVSLYRVEDLAQFVGEKYTCLVTEANPQRGNLVLSRRAVLEREKEEARRRLLESLAPGQTYEGVVRKLKDFGAFVDIGGVDGLLHVSQLAWHRVNHPSEVLSEGQTIKVKIEKVDPATGKISLAYRDMLPNPWEKAALNYPPNSIVQGTVSKLMEFGAFVQVEPGVEGLVHISELSHKRVWRTSDVVSVGDKVDVLVLSVDSEAQRMSLSIRQTIAPEPAKRPEDESPEPAAETPAKPKRKKPSSPLKGGLGRSGGGEQFGLRW